MRFQFPSLVVSKTTSTLYVWPTLEECNFALRSVEISNGNTRRPVAPSLLQQKVLGL